LVSSRGEERSRTQLRLLPPHPPEGSLRDPRVIVSVVDVGEVLLLRALPLWQGLRGASVCCAMIWFTTSECVSICLSVRDLIDRSVLSSGKDSGNLCIPWDL
jgi:hypothetical protein